jgi:hypothetical protein
MPEIPRPIIYSPQTQATWVLDCLSAQLRPFNSVKIKVVVGDLPNDVGQVGELILPKNMKPFVENSIARFSNVFKLYDTGDITGVNSYSVNLLPLIEAGNINQTKFLQGIIISPDISITGRLYMAQVTKSAELDLEIMYLGIGGKVKVHDAALQLKMVNPKTFEVIGSPVALRVRVYSAEQGASAFVIHSDTFSRAQASFVIGNPITYALQYLSDHAVANLIREYSAARFRTTFAECESKSADKGINRIPDQLDTAPGRLPLRIDLYAKKATYCAKVHPRRRGGLPAGRVRITWEQYRSNAILLGPRVSDTPSVEEVLGGEICVPIQYVNPNSDSMEMSIENENDGRLLGTARVYRR